MRPAFLTGACALTILIGCSGTSTRSGGAGGSKGPGAGAGQVNYPESPPVGSPASGGEGNAPSYGGTNSGVGGDAGAGGHASATALAPAWNEHSQRLELACSAPFDADGMIYRANRADFTPEELKILEQLKRTEPPAHESCGIDGPNCLVSITSDTGVVDEYAADPCYQPYPALDYLSLQPLLDVIPCQFLPEDAPPPLTATATCWHGIRGQESHRSLALSQPGTPYHIELDHCAGVPQIDSVTLRVFGADPQTPLATGAPVATPGTDGTCLALDVVVAEPITVDLVITASDYNVDPFGFYRPHVHWCWVARHPFTPSGISKRVGYHEARRTAARSRAAWIRSFPKCSRA